MKNIRQDGAVLKHITQLTEREAQLYGKTAITDSDISELRHIKLELDQYWDLLRQRRALREAGNDADNAEKRPVDQIENYEE